MKWVNSIKVDCLRLSQSLITPLTDTSQPAILYKDKVETYKTLVLPYIILSKSFHLRSISFNVSSHPFFLRMSLSFTFRILKRISLERQRERERFSLLYFFSLVVLPIPFIFIVSILFMYTFVGCAKNTQQSYKTEQQIPKSQDQNNKIIYNPPPPLNHKSSSPSPISHQTVKYPPVVLPVGVWCSRTREILVLRLSVLSHPHFSHLLL